MCVQMCVSASVCISCAFSSATFLLSVLSYSDLFCFILMHYTVLYYYSLDCVF